MARRCAVLACLLLGAFAPPALALDGVTVQEWNGEGSTAGAQAGCTVAGSTQEVDSDPDPIPGEDVVSFSLSADASASGTCPDLESGTFGITTTAHAEMSAGFADNGGSVDVSGSAVASASWSQSGNDDLCCGGSSVGHNRASLSISVTEATPYAITATTASQVPTSNDGGQAWGYVTLWNGGTPVARAHHYTGSIEQADSPTLDATGVLEPGSYRIEFEARCAQTSRAPSTQACSASASGQLVLGVEGPQVVFDESPVGSGNPATAVFEFHATAPEATFQCKLDTGPYAPCASPHSIEDLASGSHTFTVIAIDGEGHEGLPESVTWEVGAFDCTNSIVIGFARACGPSLAETAAGSKIYKTSAKAWVGGFEVRPRAGGKLVVDVPAVALRAEGTGVDVLFAGYEVPFLVGDIPVKLAAADLDFNQAGTLEKQLFKLPIAGKAKVAWADGGSAATFEAEIELEKLTGAFATFDTGSAKLAARLRNGIGFELTGAEVKIPDFTTTPKNLQTPRAIKLKEVLLKYELRDGKHAWDGGGTIAFPVARSMLELTGRASVYDGSLAGGSVKVAGFNKPIPDTPLFLQAVDGTLVFNPKWGFDLGVEATLGPVVADRKLIKFNGNVRGGALTSGCATAPDPAEVTLKGDIPALAELGAGSAKLEGTSCLSSTSLAMESKLKIEAALGPDAETEALLSLTGQAAGWISLDGASLEGSSMIRLPALPEVAGTNLISTKGIAACAALGFFEGGVAYPWLGVPQAFTGCDLAPWRIPATAAGARAVAGAVGGVHVDRGLPFVGFSAAAAHRPPRLRVVGPNGETFTAPGGGKAVRNRRVVIVPVASERRTYLFVRRPAAGRWRIRGLDGPIRGVRSARGLARPKVTVKVKRVKGATAKRRLVYRIRRIPRQKVRFYDRAENVAKPIGRATSRRRGTRIFKPGAGPDRSHTIEAVITSSGLPRATLTVGRFRLPN